jgi:hypothetical protein
MLSFQSKASHIIGGDIYYDYLGNNQYRFFITLYRDCNSTGADYDNPLALAIYRSNGQLFQNIDVFLLIAKQKYKIVGKDIRMVSHQVAQL